MKNELCTSYKYRIAPDGWAACDGCIHDEGLKDRYEPMTNSDRIRNMTDAVGVGKVTQHRDVYSRGA